MTTLRDLLSDFANDIIDNSGSDDPQELDELVDKYIEAICKRWVGQE